MRHLCVVLAAVAAATLSSFTCRADGDDPASRGVPPLVRFDTTGVRIETPTDTFEMRVELAESEAQRTHGLMERSSLPADAGMLFVYPDAQDPDYGFWMYRTLIPLDIAFLDEEGRIVAIRSMEPCTSVYVRQCPSYEPGVPYASALEVNRGFFEERGVGIGDRVARVDGAGGAE